MSTTTTTSSSLDYFSLLPNELLGSIFKLAGPDYTVPILCRRFYRFRVAHSYPQIYKMVKLRRFDQLIKLNRTLSIRPEYRQWIKSMHIYIRKIPHRNFLGPLLSHLCTNLPALEYVDVNDDEIVAEAILKSNIAEWAPHLKYIRLLSSFSGVVDPFEASNLVNLSKCRELSSIEFFVDRESSTVPPKTSAPTESTIVLPFPLLEDLSLEGPLSSDGPKKILEGSEPSSILLKSTDPTFDLVELLETLRNPAKVTKLIIEGCLSVSTILSRFVNLEELDLDGHACDTGFDLYGTLRSLPLKSLYLGKKSKVSIVELTRLISRQDGITTLNEIWLDNIDGDEGTFVVDEDDHDWKLPKWTVDFSKEGLRQFLEEAVDVDICVDGGAPHALVVEDMFAAALAKARNRD